MGKNRHAVQCSECERVYSARLHESELLLPTDTGTCECGATRMVDLTSDEATEVRTPVAERGDSEGEPAQ